MLLLKKWKLELDHCVESPRVVFIFKRQRGVLSPPVWLADGPGRRIECEFAAKSRKLR